MNFWIVLWTVVFAAAMGSFVVLAVVVAIGGAFDVRQMLRALDDAHRMRSQELDRDGKD